MKKRISFIKKVKLFLSFRKSVKKISDKLENDFNARIDSASRIYTVINIPPALIEDPYNLRKEDIDNLAKTYIREYSNKLSTFLNQNNLMEMYDYYDVGKVDKYSYLIIFGFSLFDSAKFMRNYYISLYTSISLVLLVALLFILL